MTELRTFPVSVAITTDQDMARLTDSLIELGRLAMAFGKIDRTACYHEDGVTKESDSDHTVMLGWIAPALAQRCFRSLDLGLVAQFALIHDAVEVYAGDTQTLRIDGDGKAAKKAREDAEPTGSSTSSTASCPGSPT